MKESAHTAALKMLARRELSEAQVRARLGRLGYDTGAIDEAVERLQSAGSLDDNRAARALARLESGVRKRGRVRVRHRLMAAGIRAETAARAIEDVFEGIDEDALLRAAAEKRLGGRTGVADRRELARLYRYLTGRGFEPERVNALLQSLPVGAEAEG